jgi:hypothetical protein
MTFKQIVEELFGFASPTYYRWKKEKRPIIELIKGSFTEQDIETFLDSGKLPYRIKAVKSLTDDELKTKLDNSHNQEILANVEKMLSGLKGGESEETTKRDKMNGLSKLSNNNGVRRQPLVMSELLEISENSYFRWKKKDHKLLIDLLESCFSIEELNEYLETNRIQELEEFKDFKKLKLSDEYQEFLKFKEFQNYNNGT